LYKNYIKWYKFQNETVSFSKQFEENKFTHFPTQQERHAASRAGDKYSICIKLHEVICRQSKDSKKVEN